MVISGCHHRSKKSHSALLPPVSLPVQTCKTRPSEPTCEYVAPRLDGYTRNKVSSRDNKIISEHL